MELLRYIYFLSQIKNLGNVRVKSIYEKYNDLDDFFKCSIHDLKKIDGIDSVISEVILNAIKNKDVILKEIDTGIEKAQRKNIRLITLFHEDYPENLKLIFDAPVILFYKGTLSRQDKYSIAIVGTRNPTEYGKYNCEKFTEQISELNIPIISGFARGIDSIVHKVCLKNKRLNYAVFGCGADVIYPYENHKMYYELTECGAVITELPPGAKPDKVNFPRRNRIISGISLGTLVIESGIKGGALLTAEIANDQNREVYALPGYINSRQSEGTNELIKRGQAKLVTCIDDIFSELETKLKPVLKKELTVREEKARETMNANEKRIYEILGYNPMHIDEINEMTQLPVSDCLVNLLSLEFKNLVRQIPGKNFTRS